MVLHQPSTGPDPDHAVITTKSSIERIPNELYWMILKDLPLYDKVRLAITSKTMYLTADPDIWESLLCHQVIEDGKGRIFVPTTHDDDRWSFLREMEKSVADHELCHYCHVFHPCGTPQERSLWRTVADPFNGDECDIKDVTFQRWGISWGFGFRDVYAVMKRHFLGGHHGMPLQDLCISTDWKFADTYKNLYNAARSPFKSFVSYTKLDTEALIRDDQLIVHRIQRLWVPIHMKGIDVLIRYGAGDIAGDFKICAHHSPRSNDLIYNFLLPLRHGLKCVLAAGSVWGIDEKDRDMPLIITRCEECPTEYSTNFRIHDHNSVEIILDVWQNLGACQSPHDPGWANCWATANPRYHGSPQEDTWRTTWTESDVAYIGDETVFSTGSRKSAVDHPSALAARQRWDNLYIPSDEPARLTAPIAVVPHMSKHQFFELKESVTQAQSSGCRRGASKFPFAFKGADGKAIPHKNMKYTRSPRPHPPTVEVPPPVEPAV
jgi:hypothetical protein